MKSTKYKSVNGQYKEPPLSFPYGLPKYEISGVTTPLQLSVLSDLYSLISHIPCNFYLLYTSPYKYKFIFFLGGFRKQFTIHPTAEALTSMYHEVLHASN